MDESEEVSAEGDVSGGSFLGQGGDLITDSGGGDLINDVMGDDSQIDRSSSLCCFPCFVCNRLRLIASPALFALAFD